MPARGASRKGSGVLPRPPQSATRPLALLRSAEPGSLRCLGLRKAIRFNGTEERSGPLPTPVGGREQEVGAEDPGGGALCDVSTAYKKWPQAAEAPISLPPCPLLAPAPPRPRVSAGPSPSWTPNMPRPSW